MLRRVAESLYWLNRYIERAENFARFVDVDFNLMLDLPSNTTPQWEHLVATTGDLRLFQARYGEATAENVFQFLIFDENYPDSVLSCFQTARSNARTIRQFISREMWQQINASYLMVEAAPGKSLSELLELLTEVKMASQLFAGMIDATMSRNQGWHFGQIGRLLERADKTSHILNVKYFMLLASEDVGNTRNEIGWMALLKSVSAYEMYRKRGQHRITSTGVAEFLILDREFPRSIQFCLQTAEKLLHQITGTPTGTANNSLERSLGCLCSSLNDRTIEEIVQSDLQEFLDNLQRQINGVNDKIVETFFALEPSD